MKGVNNGFFNDFWFLHTDFEDFSSGVYVAKRATFCVGVLHYPTDDHDAYHLAIGLTVCSPRDNFVKKTGRMKSYGQARQAWDMALRDGTTPGNPITVVNNKRISWFWLHATPKTLRLSSLDPDAVESLQRTITHYIWKRVGPFGDPKITREVELAFEKEGLGYV